MAAKRARIDVAKAFAEIDVEGFSLKVGGGDPPMLFPSMANEPGLRINLTPGSNLELPFGFDTSLKFEQPSFLTGVANKRISEGLSLRMEVSGELSDFLERMDAKLMAELRKIDQKFEWQPLVRNGQAKVVIALKGSGCTGLKIFGEETLAGSGWDFLQPHLKDCWNFRRADAKVVVRVARVWRAAGKAGVTLEATQLALKPTPKPTEEDAFPDDVEW
jgi:hypothetical protein